ncbi:diguanylate cyclase [Microbulbifer pacificus]|uniref:diguanylate cyclase n=1 Tax=Microbulbifer pacificus TaxID=407164 RepID=UPI000CF404F1|nr:diguanylate cyclase [Microbulbifer pacificus]
MRIAYWIWGLLLLCLTSIAQSGPFPISAGQQPSALTDNLLLLRDAEQKLDFDDILSAEYQRQLQPLHGRSANFGFTNAAYWVAVTLHNPLPVPRDLILRQDYPLIDRLDFWFQDSSDQWQQVATGYRRLFSSRVLNLRDFVFPVTLPANSHRTFYFRFATEGALNIGLSVSEPTAFLSQLGLEQLLLGIYYGGFLVLVMYNLFLFIAVRDRAYVYYMGYAVSYGLYFGVHNGISFQYLWPGNPWLANQSLVILLGMTLVFGIQFTRTFCNSRMLAPRTDRVSRGLLYAIVPLTAISPFVSYGPMILSLALLTMVVAVLLLVVGVISLLRGSLSARYFLVGWATLLICVILYMLKTFGLVPHNALTHNAFQFGALLEMVLLSLALGARVNEIQKRGYIDQLTGLYNRGYFDQQLPRELGNSTLTGTPLALLVLDLDHFKSINDEYGHARGDEALKAIGHLIQRLVRKPVVACRYGGEEFALLLPRTTSQAAKVVAERLVREVAQMDFGSMRLTISVGVASTEGAAAVSASEFFELADRALYKAKRDGRNRVVAVDAEILENSEALPRGNL